MTLSTSHVRHHLHLDFATHKCFKPRAGHVTVGLLPPSQKLEIVDACNTATVQTSIHEQLALTQPQLHTLSPSTSARLAICHDGSPSSSPSTNSKAGQSTFFSPSAPL